MDKALSVSDLHLRPSTPDINDLILNVILREVKEKRPKYLFIAGDIFHTKNETYESVKTLFREFLKEVTKYCEVIMLVGNHDWAREHTVHALSEYALLDKVTVVDSAYQLNDRIGFMAYARSPERFNECYANLSPSTELLVGHLALNNFALGSGYEEVDLWCDPDLVISQKPNLKKIISGHWHAHQSKTFSGVEVVYGGSPATVDQGEADQEKYMLLINLEDFSHEKIPTGLTLHKTVRINAGDDFPALPAEEIEMGVKYRIIVRGTRLQLENIKKPSNYSATVITDPIPDEEQETARSVINAFVSRADIISNYEKIKRKDIEATVEKLTHLHATGETPQEAASRIAELVFTRARKIASSAG